MDISYDDEKPALTLADRGLDFADAAKVFDGPVFEFEDDRYLYPEPRIVTYGLLGREIGGGDLDGDDDGTSHHFDEEGQ